MPKDFADRALLKRGKHGALVAKVPATGSSLAGGSVIHRSGRRKLREAMRDGRPVLVRKADGVALRAAGFLEILEAHRSPNGVILVMDVLDVDGVSYGCDCVVRKERVVASTHKFDPRPRLVKRKKS